MAFSIRRFSTIPSNLCKTAKQRRGGSGGSPPATGKKKKPNDRITSKIITEDDFEIENSGMEVIQLPSHSEESPYHPLPLPKPPAGFVLDDSGRVVMASNKRIATIDGSHYMIYTPSDPLLFVAVKDANAALQMADEELLDDPAIISAIDEETEFNALAEEETMLLESLFGKR